MILRPDHTFSPSQISTHENCPFQWQSSVQRLPQIATETKFADAGNVIHQSIAEYFKVINPTPNRGEIEGTIQTILDRNWGASGLKRMDSRKDTCLQNFVRFEDKRRRTWKQYKPTSIEQQLSVTVNSINYRTIVDAYWKEDATIVDWKSGKMNQIGVSEQIQGQVMRMVITAMGNPVNKVIFAALLVGLELEMPNVTNGFVESKIRSMIEHARLDMFPKKKSYLCVWCSYNLRCRFDGERCLWM